MGSLQDVAFAGVIIMATMGIASGEEKSKKKRPFVTWGNYKKDPMDNPAEKEAEAMYQKAIASPSMHALTLDTFDNFLLNRIEPTILIMFHLGGGCKNCKIGLAALDKVTQHLYDMEHDIVVGHVDCTDHDTRFAMKQRMNYDGFPALFFWRQSKSSTALKGLVDTMVQVTGDKSALLNASRLASMSEEKDVKRLRNLRTVGRVTHVELLDFTVRLELPGETGGIWFPMEAVTPADKREKMPSFSRNEQPYQFYPLRLTWTRNDLMDFAERMLRPAVVEITGKAQLDKAMENELLAAFVLCGPEMLPTFQDVAMEWQGKHRSFFVSEPDACPVRDGLQRPALLTYSPPHQQWSPPQSTSKVQWAKAAATVLNHADKRSRTEIAEWILSHRFPGIVEVVQTNLHMFISEHRKSLLIAVNPIAEYVEEQHEVVHEVVHNAEIEAKIQEAAVPALSYQKDGVDMYAYDKDTPFWGVIDGTLKGIERWGVYKWELPRAILFEGKSSWIDDIDYLTVQNLASDLQNVDALMRSRDDSLGLFLAFLRSCLRNYLYLEAMAAAFGEYVGIGIDIPRVGLRIYFCYRLLKLLKWILNVLWVGVMRKNHDQSDDQSTRDKPRAKAKPTPIQTLGVQKVRRRIVDGKVVDVEIDR